METRRVGRSHGVECVSAVVFHANGIGDDLINRPSLTAIAAAFEGQATLITSARQRGDFLLDDLPFRNIVRIPVSDGCFDLDFVFPYVAEPVDTFVSLAPYFSDDLTGLRNACNARRSIGFGDGYDVQVDMLARKHAVELAFDGARAVTGHALQSPTRLPLVFGAETTGNVNRFVDRIRRSRTPAILCVHSETFHNKQLPPDIIAQVVCRFLASHEDFVAVFLDVSRFDHICPCHADRVISVDDMALQFAIALLGKADLFFGIDSCMQHAADYQGVPGVVAFGPFTSPEKFGYFWSPSRFVTFSSPNDAHVVEGAVNGLDGFAALAGAFRQTGTEA